MRITKDHIAFMQKAIESATVDKNLFELEGRYRIQGLTPKRFRWDCLYAAKLSTWISDNLYKQEGLNDNHVDTALRLIMSNMDCDWASQIK